MKENTRGGTTKTLHDRALYHLYTIKHKNKTNKQKQNKKDQANK